LQLLWQKAKAERLAQEKRAKEKQKEAEVAAALEKAEKEKQLEAERAAQEKLAKETQEKEAAAALAKEEQDKNSEASAAVLALLEQQRKEAEAESTKRLAELEREELAAARLRKEKEKEEYKISQQKARAKALPKRSLLPAFEEVAKAEIDIDPAVANIMRTPEVSKEEAEVLLGMQNKFEKEIPTVPSEEEIKRGIDEENAKRAEEMRLIEVQMSYLQEQLKVAKEQKNVCWKWPHLSLLRGPVNINIHACISSFNFTQRMFK